MPTEKIRIIFITLALGMLLLVTGCKGNATPATQSAAPVATQEPAEAGSQTPVPTQQATPASEQVETSEAVATTSSPSEATEVPQESATLESEAGGGMCDNPYYPTSPGTTWTYSDSGGPAGPFTFTSSVSELRSDGFTLTLQYPGLTVTQQWACEPEGLVALQYGGGPSAALSTSQTTAQFETTEVSGVTIPASLQAGDQWQQSYKIQGTQTIGEGETGTSEGSVTYNFQALGMESVSVSAGTFEAMKIQNDMNMEITVTVSGITVPTTVTGTNTLWYAPDVGWVKSSNVNDMSGEQINETIELVEYDAP